MKSPHILLLRSLLVAFCTLTVQAYAAHAATYSIASTTATTRLVGENSSDLAGFSTAGVGDIDGDGYQDVVVGVQGYDDASNTNAGAIYIFYGSSSAADVNEGLDLNPKITGEAANDIFGVHVAAAGDLNGDGYDDFLVGASGNDDGGSGAGAVYLVYGSPTRYTGTTNASTLPEFRASTANAFVGSSFSGIGDSDNDGYDDFLVGEYTNDENGTNSGLVYLVYGSSTVYTGTHALSEYASFDNAIANDLLGITVSGAGDVNGDGYADFLMSASGNDDGVSGGGAVYLNYGSALRYTGTNYIIIYPEFTGVTVGGAAGNALASAGDVNGDGYDDFLIGASSNSDAGSSAGAAYLVYGQHDYYTDVYSLSSFAEFTGEVAGDLAGYSVSSAGDVNGDGYDDIAVGAINNDDATSNAGAAYVIYGSDTDFTGTHSLSTADFEFTGEYVGDNLGTSVSFVDDNGDGMSDVVIGAYHFYATHLGQAYIPHIYIDRDQDGVPGDRGILVGSDCADDDATASATLTEYLDADGDGLGDIGSVNYVCSATAESGYVTNFDDLNDDDYDNDGVSTGLDCDDTNAAGYQEVTFVRDADGDGRGDFEDAFLGCEVDSYTGYIIATDDVESDANDTDYDNDGVSASSDCNDSNSSLTSVITYYADTDDDGLGDPDSSTSVCSLSAPTGYVSNNSDVAGEASVDAPSGDEGAVADEVASEDPEDTEVFSSAVSSIEGLKYGKVRVRFSDGSSSTYTVFDAPHATRVTKVLSYNGTGYLLILNAKGKKLALVNAYTGEVYDTLKTSKVTRKARFLKTVDFRSDDSLELIVSLKNVKDSLNGRVVLVRVNTTTHRLTKLSAKNFEGETVRVKKTKKNHNKLLLRKKNGDTVLTYTVNSSYKFH